MGTSEREAEVELNEYQMKILVMLYKLHVLGSRRVGDFFSGWRETAEKYLMELDEMGFARIQAIKFFRGREANLWELTESGRAFIEEKYRSGKVPKIKISEMEKKFAEACFEVMKLLEKPLSLNEIYTSLNASGVKIRRYKLNDVLKILEATEQVIKTQGFKNVVVYMKANGADIESAAL